MYEPRFPKPKITPAFKKRILKDWQPFFPGLRPKPPLSLDRRVGPLLISIAFGLRSGREDYYPTFSVHNLCDPLDFLASILDTPLRIIKTMAADRITVRAHEEGKYIEAAERMKQQSPLPLEGPISLNMIIEAYKKFLKGGGIKTISLVTDPALIAAWAGQKEKAKDLLDWGCSEYSTWPERAFERHGDPKSWYKDMQERISNPEKLRVIAQEQAVFHKVDHIPMEEIIVD